MAVSTLPMFVVPKQRRCTMRAAKSLLLGVLAVSFPVLGLLGNACMRRDSASTTETSDAPPPYQAPFIIAELGLSFRLPSGWSVRPFTGDRSYYPAAAKSVWLIVPSNAPNDPGEGCGLFLVTSDWRGNAAAWAQEHLRSDASTLIEPLSYLLPRIPDSYALSSRAENRTSSKSVYFKVNQSRLVALVYFSSLEGIPRGTSLRVTEACESILQSIAPQP